ncbi:hypothetical protein G7Y89_g5121 [Cudoniella acicularis]|uniref:Amidoligase enzyme n=1 Tax=Cudoniella acicularis TaxID=354080 RepID=A0A8H4RPF3_9HELO|nr:hypothetical protein G7Y89_g5121 [Cudoniella acicularis]
MSSSYNRRARAGSLQPPAAQASTSRRAHRRTDPDETSELPTQLFSDDHLPLSFGAEFEMIIRPRADFLQRYSLVLPPFDSSERAFRDFNFSLLRSISNLITMTLFPCVVYDQNEGPKPNYKMEWHVTLDGSLSKKHRRDGFYPVEIVSSIIRGDASWAMVIDKFWAMLNTSFEFRRDMSCGFHIHISPATESYSLAQLRQMAKAVAFWEPMTARCAPPSRQDDVLGMFKSNVSNALSLAVDLSTVGGFAYVCRQIDSLARDEVCEYLCPDKHNSWNFRNAKEGGFGSIEFRRPPGVVDAKKAKHWIAFTMAFVEMAVQFNPAHFLHQPLPADEDEAVESSCLHREEKAFDHCLLACAKKLGVYAQLDPRLRQPDNTHSLHITSLSKEAMEWLKQHGDYQWSINS